MVVKLYKNDVSPVARACMMACDLLNVQAEMIDVDVFKGEHLAPEFVKKNPLHAVPVLEDGDLVLHDSHAILMYLAEKYDKNGSLYPKDMKQRALVNQKLFFSISFVYMRLRDITGPLIFEGEKPSEKRFKAIDETYGFLEEFLSRTKYLAGDSMTIADISAFASGVALGFLVELDGQKYPKLHAWMTTMKQMPVSQKFNAPGHSAYEKFIKKLLAA
ncbi:glutathione S-transferase 1-like [Choristoneura fumiferana]|uniref:glutathione S-transferase 1-like n=1 Tax=Choristoneura fumiferana TaxID=7141 RepID=UPI003D15B761